MSDPLTLSPPRSLQDVHGSVPVPGGHWWRRLVAFAGPAYLVSVGYMDPGNWATDLQGGSLFGYRLLWVLLMSNAMAVLLQTLSARLGLASGRDLAQACRDSYGPGVRWALFFLCEIAIAACDLAEVLGTAIGINLLFPSIPLLWGVLLTGLDVFLLLAIQRWGMRKMEAFIVSLISIIGVCYVIEIFLSHPSWSGIAQGIVPRPLTGRVGGNTELYIAIGIIGATVMPHNLYLHSALVQSRKVAQTEEGVRQACRFNLIDSVVAMNLAFFVNAAILIVAAAVFWSRGAQVAEIKDAHRLLHDLLGTRVAPIVFALALICAGQSSTLTGTLAGQITMEGFLHFRMRPWLRRFVTRALAIIPAVLVIGWYGEGGTDRLLVLSQVILSLQLPFAVVPLIKFTSSRRKMGPFVNPMWVQVLAWVVAAIIIGLNAWLTYDSVHEWLAGLSGVAGRVLLAGAVLVVGAIGLLLAYMIVRREPAVAERVPVSAAEVIDAAGAIGRAFHRIGVALEAKPQDAAMLAEAIALARTHRAELVLLHVVEGVGGQFHGRHAGDAESFEDEKYLREMTKRLRCDLGPDVPDVQYALGFGDVSRALIQLVRDRRVDLLVLGGHGHGRLADLLRGETVNSVRHGLHIPVMAVRGARS